MLLSRHEFWYRRELIVLPAIFVIFWPDSECSRVGLKYRYYSVKTAYDEVRYKGEWNDFGAGCQTRLVYMVSRHGTRYNVTDPGHGAFLSEIKDQVIRSSRLANGTLTAEEVERIGRWEMRMHSSRNMELTPAGWSELEGIGRRLANRVPGLGSTPHYDIRHTNRGTGGTRSRDSARALATGIFGSYEGKFLLENPNPDWLLQFYIFCEAYRKVADEPLKKMEVFLDGPEFKEMIYNVTTRLGVAPETFDKYTIYLLYDMCRFEYGIYRDSPWCAAFDTRSLKVLEFVEDIRYYWKFGYGQEINFLQTCDLIKDLHQHITTIINGQHTGSPKLVARIGHSGTFQTFLARLGFLHDQFHLTAAGIVKQEKRKWRNSLRFPMGGNIIFSINSCSNEFISISAYLNELPVIIPGCKMSPCPLNVFLPSLKQMADCDIHKICNAT